MISAEAQAGQVTGVKSANVEVVGGPGSITCGGEGVFGEGCYDCGESDAKASLTFVGKGRGNVVYETSYQYVGKGQGNLTIKGPKKSVFGVFVPVLFGLSIAAAILFCPFPIVDTTDPAAAPAANRMTTTHMPAKTTHA